MGETDVEDIIVERIIGCTKGEFPIKYLGLPLRETRIRKGD